MNPEAIGGISHSRDKVGGYLPELDNPEKTYVKMSEMRGRRVKSQTFPREEIIVFTLGVKSNHSDEFVPDHTFIPAAIELRNCSDVVRRLVDMHNEAHLDKDPNMIDYTAKLLPPYLFHRHAIEK
jgi:hypothetical protein